MKVFTLFLTLDLIGLGCFYTCSAHAMPIIDREIMIYPGDEDYVNPKWPIEEKCFKHSIHMREWFEKSKKIVWYMPSKEDSEKGKLCFATAVAVATPPHNYAKLIGVTITIFVQYGLDCIDAFHEANHCLHRAKYHAEMYEFYLGLIPDDYKVARRYVVNGVAYEDLQEE
jgi:hypothetical protein